MISDHNTDKFNIFLEGRTTPEPDSNLPENIMRTSNGHATDAHFRNYFDAVRAGKRDLLAAEIHETYLSTAYCLLGNISYRLNRELRFDSSAQRFHGDPEADKMLRDTCRAPFTVPDRV
jgi:hypothetical protein